MQANQPRSITVTTGTVVKTLAILLACAVLWQIRDILLYVFIALLLAGLIYPAARWSAKRRIPKSLAVIVIYLVLLGVLGLIFTLLIPAIVDQARLLAGTYGDPSDWLSQSVNSVKNTLDNYGFTANLQSGLTDLPAQLQRAMGGFFGALSSVFGGVMGLLIVLVMAFYFVVDDSALRTVFLHLIPPRHQELASRLAVQVVERLGHWLRAQLLLSLIVATVYFIGFSIIGVPYALLIAIISGLLEFIPFLGPITAGLSAVVLAFTVSPWQALATLIFVVVIQQLDYNLLVPRIMRKAVGLNPVVSIMAFIIGLRLFGVAGAIFAIPLATAVSVAVSEIFSARRSERRVAEE